MPGLTFHPELHRHLGFVALGHCFEHYRLNREVAAGRLAERPAGKSLLIGIGLDLGTGHFWACAQRGEAWNPEAAWEHAATEIARECASQEGGFASLWASVEDEIRNGIYQYAEQWEGIRGWEIVQVHPYQDETWVRAHTLLLADGSGYLPMPDLVIRMNGVLTIVDAKTSAYPYKKEHWAFDPQMLVNCLATGSEQFLIDYMQRPKTWGKAASTHWTFPPTEAFPFDEARRKLAESWLQLGTTRLAAMAVLQQARVDLRDPAACRTWYGRCEWEARCFGSERGEETDAV